MLSAEKIQKKIYNTIGKDYEYISGYERHESTIKILHKKCGRTFSKSYRCITKNSSCNICNGREKTDADLIQKVKVSLGEDFTYKGGYINNTSILKIFHKNCNSEFKLSNAYIGNRKKSKIFNCPICTPKNWDIERVKKHINDSMGSQYKYISMFKNSHSTVMVKHLKCSHIFNKNLRSMEKKGGCPICDKGQLLLPSEFIKKLLKLRGSEYQLIKYKTTERGYISFEQGVFIKHTVCKHVFKIPSAFFYRTTPCAYCAQNFTKNTEIYRKEVKDLVGNNYIVVDDYLNTGTPIEHIHVECGHHFLMSPNNFKRGQRCPIGCEFSSRPKSNWKKKYCPYPIKVKPSKNLRVR